MNALLRITSARYAPVPFILDIVILSVILYYILLFFRTYTYKPKDKAPGDLQVLGTAPEEVSIEIKR